MSAIKLLRYATMLVFVLASIRVLTGASDLTRWQLKEFVKWRKTYVEVKLVQPDEAIMIKKINRIKNGEKIV